MLPTIEQDIDAALKTVGAAGKVWNLINTTEPAVYPYIVFTIIPSSDNVTLEGPSDLQNTAVQVDCFDRTGAGAALLAKQARVALLDYFSTYPQSCVPQSGFSKYEAPVKAFRKSADYSIWSTN